MAVLPLGISSPVIAWSDLEVRNNVNRGPSHESHIPSLFRRSSRPARVLCRGADHESYSRVESQSVMVHALNPERTTAPELVDTAPEAHDSCTHTCPCPLACTACSVAWQATADDASRGEP